MPWPALLGQSQAVLAPAIIYLDREPGNPAGGLIDRNLQADGSSRRTSASETAGNAGFYISQANFVARPAWASTQYYQRC